VRTLLAAAALALVSAPTWAQIYKSTDQDGNVIFTDTPPPDSPATQEVELQRTNTAPPPPDLPQASTRSNESKSEAPPVPKATITAPANDTTFPVGLAGSFSVSAHVDPPLGRGEGLRLTVDGEPRGGPQASGFWDLNNVYRGTHTLIVEVVDADGAVLSSSEPIQVHVMRTSVN
jgi:hypothetical protein